MTLANTILADQLQARRTELETLLQRAVTLLKADDRVVAAWLGGSLGRGSQDDLSDLDLYVVVADEYIAAITARRREYVARLGLPLLIQDVPQNSPPGGAFLLVLYNGSAGPLEIDWNWLPQSNAYIPPQAHLLFDYVDLPSAASPQQPTPQARAQVVTDDVIFFWAMSKVAAKKIARRQPWAALNLLAMLRRVLHNIQWMTETTTVITPWEDRSTDLVPGTPAEQMIFLRELAQQMEALAPQIRAVNATTPDQSIPQIYDFFALAETLIKQKDVTA